MRVYVLLQTRRSNLGDEFGENWLGSCGLEAGALDSQLSVVKFNTAQGATQDYLRLNGLWVSCKMRHEQCIPVGLESALYEGALVDFDTP